MRFADHTKPDAFVKLMTDGILLAETQGDPLLAAYDTIIVDEAHERSLNIDFLLGYLKELLPRRPDLKVIVTSATLDAERFARHFGTPGDPAPVIEVSGRVFPVEIRYRPLTTAGEEADDEEELEDAIVAAAEDLWRERSGRHPRVPARRARDSRDRASCWASTRASAVRVGARDPAAVRASHRRRAAARIRAVRRTADRARDQCRGDFAHRSAGSAT